jgi:hypothetical protein
MGETIIINCTKREYEFLEECQDNYYKIFGRMPTLEQLFKESIFINNIKLIQKVAVKPTKQTTLGGLTP